MERLTEECGVARDEVKGLKYQLSSANMELQQSKEVLETILKEVPEANLLLFKPYAFPLALMKTALPPSLYYRRLRSCPRSYVRERRS